MARLRPDLLGQLTALLQTLQLELVSAPFGEGNESVMFCHLF